MIKETVLNMSQQSQKTSGAPAFAVVGHPNKGKSSLVATLTQNDQVQISQVSGTTEHSQKFPMEVDGQLCYWLIDTPGFQRARALLHQLQGASEHAGDRRQALQQFVDDPESERRFPDEVRLLKPILEGAAVIYVVDGAKPYRPEYESEMEILRWSGQPRMAVINPITSDRYVDDWQQALDQFFSLVRVFNPMASSFEDHLELIGAFGTLRRDWQPPVQRAVKALQEDRQQRLDRAVQEILTLCIDSLCYQVQGRIPALGDDSQTSQTLQKEAQQRVQERLEQNYKNHLRDLEKSTRQRVESLFRHYHIAREEADLSVDQGDLFNQADWVIWGLDRKQLLVYSAGGGAATGALVDVGVGGSSLFLGALTGSVLATATTWFMGDKLAKVKVGQWLPMGGQELTVGPMQNSQFAWVLFGRAWHHLLRVINRNHARRDHLALDTIEEKTFDLNHYLKELPKREAFVLSSWLGSKGKRASMLSRQGRVKDIILKHMLPENINL